MQVVDDQMLTVAEVAELLRVAPSTVRRWIRAGDVPAYRIGGRRVAIRRSDLGALVEPLRVDANPKAAESDTDEGRNPIRKLTPEERARALAALAELQRLREELLAERGGRPFSPAWKLVNESRDERIDQLP